MSAAHSSTDGRPHCGGERCETHRKRWYTSRRRGGDVGPTTDRGGDTTCEECGSDAIWQFHPHAHPRYIIMCPTCGQYEPEAPVDEPDSYYADE